MWHTLHLVVFYGKCIGTCTIHGCYGNHFKGHGNSPSPRKGNSQHNWQVPTFQTFRHLFVGVQFLTSICWGHFGRTYTANMEVFKKCGHSVRESCHKWHEIWLEGYILDLRPPSSNSGKWRFSSGIPNLKMSCHPGDDCILGGGLDPGLYSHLVIYGAHPP